MPDLPTRIFNKLPPSCEQSSPRQTPLTKRTKPWKQAIILLVLLILGCNLFNKIQRKFFFPVDLQLEMSLGKKGGISKVKGEFCGPAQIRVDSTLQRICLVDGIFWKLIFWNKDTGAYIQDLGKEQVGLPEFYPLNCDFDLQGNIYVVDRYRSEILVFSPNYKLLKSWSISALAQDITVDTHGNAYVVDLHTQEVVKYNAQGEELLRFGKGKLKDAGFLAADAEDNIYVVERAQKKVQVFSSRGKWTRGWALSLLSPIGNPNIQVQNRKVYISERDNHLIMAYNTSGQALWSARIYAPTVIGVDTQERIYVSGPQSIDKYRIKKNSVFALMKWGHIRSFLEKKIIHDLCGFQPQPKGFLAWRSIPCLLTWGMVRGELIRKYWHDWLLLVVIIILILSFDRLWSWGKWKTQIVISGLQELAKVYSKQGIRKLCYEIYLHLLAWSKRQQTLWLRLMKHKAVSIILAIGLAVTLAYLFKLYVHKITHSHWPQAEGVYLVLGMVGMALLMTWLRIKKIVFSKALAVVLLFAPITAQIIVTRRPEIALFLFVLTGFLLFVIRPRFSHKHALLDFSARCQPLTKREFLFFLLMLTIAFFTRFFTINDFPRGFAYEELIMAEYVQRTANTYIAVFMDGNMGMPSLMAYQGYYLCKLLGWTIENLRLVPQFYDFLTIVAFYFLCRRFTSPLTAASMAILFAMASWHFVVARRFYPYAIIFLSPLLSMGFLAIGLRKHRASIFLFAGMACGLSLFGYEAGRGVILIFVFWMIWMAVFHRRNLPSFRIVLFFFIGFIISASPILYHITFHWDNYWGYIQQHANPNRGQSFFNYFQYLWFKLRPYAGMFHYRSGQNPDMQLCWLPILDPITGALFAVSLFFCLARFWRPVPAFLLLYFFAGMMPGLLGSGNIPHLRRVTLVIPAVYLICALGMERLIQISRLYLGSRGRKIFIVVLVLAVGTAALINGHHYFYRFADDPRICSTYLYREYMLCEEMKKYPKTQFHVSGHPHAFYADASWGIFIDYKSLTIFKTFEESLILPPDKDHIIFLEGYMEAFRSFYESTFPGSIIKIDRATDMKECYFDPKREYRLDIKSTDPVNPDVYYIKVFIPKKDVNAFHSLINITDKQQPRRIAVFSPGFANRFQGRHITLTGAVILNKKSPCRFQIAWKQWQLRLDGSPADQASDYTLGTGIHFFEMSGVVPQTAEGSLPFTVYSGKQDITRNGQVVALLPQKGVHCSYFRKGGEDETKTEEIAYQSILPFQRLYWPTIALPFYARCTGCFYVPINGQYSFKVKNTPCRLLINGQAVYNQENDYVPPTITKTHLRTGERVRFDAVCPVENYLNRRTFMIFYQAPDSSKWRWIPWEWFD